MTSGVPVLFLLVAGGARLASAQAQPLPLTDGGWGLMARFADTAGLEVTAPDR